MKHYLLFITIALQLACSSVKVSNSSKQQVLIDLETLSADEYEGRKTGTKGAEMTRAYLIKRLGEIGVSFHPSLGKYEQDFVFNRRGGTSIKGTNIIAYIPGKTDQTLVISAHYDHLGIINGEIYNGADDNASGVAALLDFASYFKNNKPKHSLILAFFDAEEMGLQGARAFVNTPPVPLNQIELNLNMDMISHNDKNELYIAGTFKYPNLKKFITTSIPNIKLKLGHDDPQLGHDDWTNQSDQGAFNAKNIPFLYFGVEDHKDYHKASDEYANINKEFYLNAVAAIKQIIINIDQERDIQAIFRENLKMNKQ